MVGYNLKNGNTSSCGCYQRERIHEVNSITSKKSWQPIDINEDTYGIPLTKDMIAFIYKKDFDKVKDYGWYAKYNKHTESYYAATEIANKGVLMHSLILVAPDGVCVDHKDRNTLNNRASNLRFCSPSENAFNSKRRSDSTSGYRGVSFHKATGKYRARITINGKTIALGTFGTAEEAYEIYKVEAKKLHGEFYCE